MSARSCDQLCPITADHMAVMISVAPSVPRASAHQCHINATYQCTSMPHLSAHLSCLSMSPISAAFQCLSVMPVNAHQCNLPLPPHQCHL
ncbi:unnamed protein product [Staurois parvus]|uniref:Uncharacterized protein n=1 Tax=Staurois parvus TaxID=386267 RepID=A0ABN9FXM2_9NEOB|nr:unnamed protein product [Staurois parvus]